MADKFLGTLSCPHCGDAKPERLPSSGDYSDHRCPTCGNYRISGTQEHLFGEGRGPDKGAGSP